MPFAWFVALRYLREGRMQTLLILSGVAVGVGVIIFLAALIDGLQASLVQQTLGTQAHVVVRRPDEAPRLLTDGDGAGLVVRVEQPAQRLRAIDQWRQVMAQLETTPGVTAVSPSVAGPAFASRGAADRSVTLRGVEPDRFNRIVDVRAAIRSGRFLLAGANAVIGVELARDLGVSAGDQIRLSTAAGRAETFTVSGIFDLDNKEINQRWVLVSLREGQTLLDLVGGVSTLEAKVARIFDAEQIAARIAASTGLTVESWMTLNRQLLVGLRSQNSSRYMIQTFVILAVTLGIASVLVVWVVQKNREIGILRAMGTTRRQVARIFLIQGGLLGFGGWILGSLFGALLSLVFARMARNPDGSPTFPVALTPELFLGTLVLALAVGHFSAVGPARRAALLDPAQAIHHG